MEHLAPVVASLQLAKTQLEQELATVNQMLALTTPVVGDVPAAPPRPLVNDKRRAAQGDKDAQKREEESRWKNGASPKKTGGKKKEHPVQEKIVTDLLARAQEHSKSGKSFVPDIPGSFTAQELADEAGYSIGTVRRAFKELEKRGAVSARKMSWKELGKTSPAGPVNVLVAV